MKEREVMCNNKNSSMAHCVVSAAWGYSLKKKSKQSVSRFIISDINVFGRKHRQRNSEKRWWLNDLYTLCFEFELRSPLPDHPPDFIARDNPTNKQTKPNSQVLSPFAIKVHSFKAPFLSNSLQLEPAGFAWNTGPMHEHGVENAQRSWISQCRPLE